MKKRVALVVLILSSAVFGCEKIYELINFSVSNQVIIQIPSSTVIDLLIEIPTPDVTTNSEQTFANNKTEASLVKDVKLRELKLTITDPASKTFSFLKSIHIYISTGQNKENEIELGYLDDVPETVNNITLTPTKAKLDEYLKAKTYNLRTVIVTREALTESVDMRADLKFTVTAEPL